MKVKTSFLTSCTLINNQLTSMRETIMLLYHNDTDNDIMLYVYNFDLHLYLQYT